MRQFLAGNETGRGPDPGSRGSVPVTDPPPAKPDSAATMVDVESEPLRAELRAAADHEPARTARRQICQTLATGLKQLSESLRVAGYFVGPDRVSGSSPTGNGDDRLVSLGYLSATAAALISGADDLIGRGNLYAGSALNRQLVEVEYLAWAFAEDQAEAANWLRSSPEERQRRWAPRHLRKRSRGRFRGSDYHDHCEFGGHPTPAGARALLGVDSEKSTTLGGDGPSTRELLLFEVAQHGTSVWQYLLTGVAVLCLELQWDPKLLVTDGPTKAVGDAEAAWRGEERLGVVWEARDSADSIND